jgi:ABC-type uncharacterized transport system permease subunit
LGAAIVMFAGLQLILHRTRIGLSIRAVAANPLGAQFVASTPTAPWSPPSPSAPRSAPPPGC